MNLQSLVVVVLRLLALDFLLRVAMLLTPQIVRALQALGMYSPSSFAEAMSGLVLPHLVLAAMIAAAVLLWVLAPAIARLVTRGVSHELSFGAMSLADCYSIAFMAVGLLYIASHLPQVLNWTHYLFKAAASRPGGTWKEGVQWYDLSQAIVPFIFGVVLFVKGRAWALALARKQQRAESANHEQ